MQSVSVSLEGKFWDSQIYSGELTLFGSEGSVYRVDWRKFVDEIATKNFEIQTALRVAFSDSDLFYTQKVRKILRDPAIEQVVKAQLKSLAESDLNVVKLDWESYSKTVESPFPDLPVDSEIYYHTIFAGTDNGLFSAPRTFGGSGKYARKHHDGRIMQLRASKKSTAIAAAGGADGLHEFGFVAGTEEVLGDATQLANRSCQACDWAFQSVIAWDADRAFFANFRSEKAVNTGRSMRIFDQIIDEEAIFAEGHDASSSYVWGSHEKVFKISPAGLFVLNYEPTSKKPTASDRAASENSVAGKASELFSTKGEAKVDFSPHEIVSTGTAPFGSIIELPDRLLVLRSDNTVDTFAGEPVHWRVYPRSEHYSNQLHIIYDDYVQIISFVHDYFVDQRTKLTGFEKGSNDYIKYGS